MLRVSAVLFSLASGLLCGNADTLVFVHQVNNYWPDPANWFTVDPMTQNLVAAGRAPLAGDSATISAGELVDLTGLNLNISTLTLNTDSTVSNGLMTASTVVMFAGTVGSQTGFQNTILTVLSEMDVLGGSCGLSSTTLTIKPGAVALLGALGVTGQLTMANSTIFNFGQITLTANNTFLSGGTNFVNETNALIVASTNATFGGTACVFDNSGTIRCDGGTFSIGQFLSWASQSGQAQFETTRPTAAINFASGLTVPSGATNYFYGPGTNYWFGATVLGTAQIGFQDPNTLAFTNGNFFFTSTIGGNGAIHASSAQGLGSTLLWVNSTLNGPNVNIDSLSQMLVEDRFTHELASGAINNAGSFIWTNGATLSIDSGTVFNNLPTGNVYAMISNPGTDASVVGSGVFNNSGAFHKSVGTNSLAFAASGGGPAFNNTGLLDIQSGYVQLAGGTNSGTFSLLGGELRFGYNNSYLEPGVQFLGTNFVRALGPGAVIVDTSVTLANFDLQNSPAVLDGPGNLIVSNTCVLANGTVQGSGTLTIPQGALLNVNGSASWAQRTINNSGTTTVTGQLITQGGGIFNNLAGAVFDLQNNNGIGAGSGSTPGFNNFGLFKKSAGGSVSSMSPLFTNNATVQIQSGTVNFNSGYQQTGGSTTIASNTVLQAGGNGVSLSGGMLAGLGTISGSVSNSATVFPGPLGTLTILGNYAQNSSGTLAIALGGTASGQYSRLTISSLLAIAGTLNITLTNGFLPAVGNIFTVATAGAAPSGRFGSVVGSRAPNGVALVPQYPANMLNLVAANDLVLSNASFAGNNFNFKYPSTAGLTNIAGYTTNLTPPVNWHVLTNIPGDGAIKSVLDPSATNAQRFYRVGFQ